MKNQAIRKSKRLKEKHTKTIAHNDKKINSHSVQRSKLYPEKSNLIDDDESYSKKTSIYDEKIDYSNGANKEDTNDSGSDIGQNFSRKNKRSRKSTLNNIDSDSASSGGNEEIACCSKIVDNSSTALVLENVNIYSSNNIDKDEDSDTDSSLSKSKSCNKLKRLKENSSEEEVEKDNTFKTPIKKKVGVDVPTSSAVKRSSRLNSRSELSPGLLSRSRILDKINYTPVKEKDVRYYRQKRGIQQNNLVKWFVYFPYILIGDSSNK